MSARRTTARFSLASALIAGLALTGAVAPASAAGEVDGLYSATGGLFVQLDKTTAAPTPVGSDYDEFDFESVEVVNGVGYAVGEYFDETEEVEIPAVFTWDITTGAVLSVVATTFEGDLYGTSALDTLADGTLLTYISVADDEWVASVNPVTGALTPLVNLDEFEDTPIFEGIATNPVDGVTYLLSDYDDGMPGMLAIDFATGTLGEYIALEGIQATVGAGYINEGDFDAAGVLWFTYSGAGVSRTNDAPVDVATEATELGDPEINSSAITVGSGSAIAPAAPQLAATGLELAPVAGGAAILFALGGALLLARRRAQA